jgi:hypothetical protein
MTKAMAKTSTIRVKRTTRRTRLQRERARVAAAAAPAHRLHRSRKRKKQAPKLQGARSSVAATAAPARRVLGLSPLLMVLPTVANVGCAIVALPRGIASVGAMVFASRMGAVGLCQSIGCRARDR